ncbi:MAG: hypothetical protein V4510_12745 [bacterium]
MRTVLLYLHNVDDRAPAAEVAELVQDMLDSEPGGAWVGIRVSHLPPPEKA